MSESVRMWTEITFNVVYLLAVWGLVIAMTRHRSAVEPGKRSTAAFVRWAFTLLALGDTGHVGFRVLAYAQGDLNVSFGLLGRQVGLVGLGAMATAFTVTLFYVMMLYAWRARFDRDYGWFEVLLLTAAVIRVVLLLPAANQWSNVTPPQPWSIYRNLPLIVQGLGVALLMLRDARTTRDFTFLWIGVMIVTSYACYIPVVLFIQRVPLLGMLMIPKTLAYLAIGLLAYADLYRADASSLVVQSVSD